MKKSLSLFLIILFSFKIYSQCNVVASASPDTVVCGSASTLSVFGQGQGVALLSENFNTGSFGPGWSSSPQAMWNNPCSPNGVDGTTHIWMGNSSPVPRALTTASFDLSNCVNAGVTICFDMKFAQQGQNAPCEGPDEPDEGVYLQYSINNGASWTDIHYFNPNGGSDPQLVNWNNWCFPVPTVALTANTRFRWFQNNDSGADYDHWGIDNVIIYCNDPTYNIVWQHDGYNHGPTGGTNPNPVAPHTTTTYTVVMSNGAVSCTSSVTVVVRNPTLIVNAGNDTTICTGTCAQLNATAKVLVSPAKVITYANNELTPITTGLGQVSNIGINVTGLNMTSILPNSITQVCINNVFFFGFGGFPPVQIDISDLILTLVCPSGQSIVLVPANVTNGGSNPLTGGYTNTCFVPAGGANIAGGTAPYTGNWAPNQPFNNLTGCTGNGVWLLNVTMNTALGFGQGTFSGWTITFDDPEISYTGNFSWSPTTNMSNSNTLTPTVCPPPNTYTITVSDTAGCVTASDAVTVNTQACCNLSATTSTTQPGCAVSNGAINVTPQPAGNYNYLWNDGNTQQNRTGLAAGTYSVTITDATDPNCTFATSITLNSNSTLNVSLTNPVNPTCAGNDGQITAGLTGGTAPYTVTIDTGGTPQTLTLPFPITQTIPNVPAGTVNISVVDAQGCVASATATLAAPANCCTFTYTSASTQPSCGQNDGGISLTVANGSGNYSYNWSTGATGSSITNVGAGSYTVTITDNAYANCFQDTTINLSNPNAPVINSVNTTAETCTGSDGSATINASGGTGTLTYTWNTNPTQTTATAVNLTANTYNFTVTDANNCQATGSAVVPLNCVVCNLQTSATVVPPACGQTTGTITISVTNAGTTPYTYSINGTNFQQSNTFSNVTAGTYDVITQDAAQCFDTVTVTMPQGGSNLNVSVAAANVTCFGANDGSVTATSNNGSAPFSYVWNNGATTASLASLTPGNYSVTVTDTDGCTGVASGNITQPAQLTLNIGNDVTVCEGSTVQLSAGNNFTTYSWSSGETTAAVTVTTGDTYSVTVTDANGCTAADALNVTVIPTPQVDLGDDKVVYEGQHVGLFGNVSGNPQSGTFNWQPNTLLSCNDCQNTVATAQDTITYILSYTDAFGCTSSDDITLYVLPVTQVFFPNAFTPNGDGNNDIYFVFGGSIKMIALTIFNRWGEKVFDSDNQFVGWDGNYKGKPQPPGVYVYYAKVLLMNDEERKFTGSLTLIR
ncbi:MAG: gliding motility-associated C-terminal domain-containing protein [Chitinophagales bacterium]|nr:gliding motility-associated C-terminal domain-containing protein [Chitinophagales bacterium]